MPAVFGFFMMIYNSRLSGAAESCGWAWIENSA